jgi:hypothetical protein
MSMRCAQRSPRGVELLNGPADRLWGVRTASFVDPRRSYLEDREIGDTHYQPPPLLLPLPQLPPLLLPLLELLELLELLQLLELLELLQLLELLELLELLRRRSSWASWRAASAR